MKTCTLISLSDESSLRMGDIDHIPQTKASYDRLLEPIPLSPHPLGENIGEDPRDHIYKCQHYLQFTWKFEDYNCLNDILTVLFLLTRQNTR